GEDRIVAEEQADPAIAPETVAVQPKRVKTMVVKPDGSMVLREQPAAPAVEAAPAENAQVEAAKPVAPAAEPEVTFTPPAAPEKPVVEVAAVEPEAPVAAKVAEPVDTVEAAIAEPVAPKPAKAVKKPVQKAKKPEPAPEQVALAEPEAAAPATGGGWSIQIASQPSKDGAQASYKSLASKFGSIIGGKGVQIIPAQIEGKGTFYRVRIPAGSKEEAAALCARYKSAGGSCFPSR
ncbi:MAG: SPOR domain-containing protein, partial [Rhizobiaceae bacterium]